MIGFERTMHQFSEDAGVALLNVTILSGILRIPVVVSLSLSSGTAMGKFDVVVFAVFILVIM